MNQMTWVSGERNKKDPKGSRKSLLGLFFSVVYTQ